MSLNKSYSADDVCEDMNDILPCMSSDESSKKYVGELFEESIASNLISECVFICCHFIKTIECKDMCVNFINCTSEMEPKFDSCTGIMDIRVIERVIIPEGFMSHLMPQKINEDVDHEDQMNAFLEL